MMRLACFGLLLASLQLACVSTYADTPVAVFEIEPGVTTKAEVIQQLGTPDGVRAQADGRVLTFGYGEVNGSGFGLGSFAIQIAVESTHQGLDFLEVFVGPDNIVRSYRLVQNARRSPNWP